MAITAKKLQFLAATVGLLAAGYLTYIKLFESGVCAVSHGCQVVQTSQWSEIAGIPVSAVGMAGYLLILLLLFGNHRSLLLVLVSGFGFVFSSYMMYRSFVTIGATCPFCVTSAVCMTALFALSSYLFVQGDSDQPMGGSPSTSIELES